jgi:hypothetical protein
MRVLASLPARHIDGADQVLDGIAAEVASGNQVRVWPALTYDWEANQTRIAFFTEWRRSPTPEDQWELITHTDALMGRGPALMTETQGDPTADKQNVEWLRTGKPPKPRKTN